MSRRKHTRRKGDKRDRRDTRATRDTRDCRAIEKREGYVRATGDGRRAYGSEMECLQSLVSRKYMARELGSMGSCRGSFGVGVRLMGRG